MITPEKEEVLRRFGEGRRAYTQMDFAKAKVWFEQALEVDPHDGPSQVYLQRCQELIDNPPPVDWDGVFVMKTK